LLIVQVTRLATSVVVNSPKGSEPRFQETLGSISSCGPASTRPRQPAAVSVPP
jgi:hypothetical protein